VGGENAKDYLGADLVEAEADEQDDQQEPGVTARSETANIYSQVNFVFLPILVYSPFLSNFNICSMV